MGKNTFSARHVSATIVFALSSVCGRRQKCARASKNVHTIRSKWISHRQAIGISRAKLLYFMSFFTRAKTCTGTITKPTTLRSFHVTNCNYTILNGTHSHKLATSTYTCIAYAYEARAKYNDFSNKLRLLQFRPGTIVNNRTRSRRELRCAPPPQTK